MGCSAPLNELRPDSASADRKCKAYFTGSTSGTCLEPNTNFEGLGPTSPSQTRTSCTLYGNGAGMHGDLACARGRRNDVGLEFPVQVALVPCDHRRRLAVGFVAIQ